MKTIISTLALAALLTGCGGSDAGKPTASRPAVTKQAKGVAVTLKSVEVGRDIGPVGLVPSAQDGATYVLAIYSLKNTGAAALPLDKWPQPRLVDPGGHGLEPEMMNSTMLSAAANPSWAETINPNLSTDASLVWKIDEKAFDRATWTIRFQSSPPITFSLK